MSVQNSTGEGDSDICYTGHVSINATEEGLSTLYNAGVVSTCFTGEDYFNICYTELTFYQPGIVTLLLVIKNWMSIIPLGKFTLLFVYKWCIYLKVLYPRFCGTIATGLEIFTSFGTLTT